MRRRLIIAVIFLLVGAVVAWRCAKWSPLGGTVTTIQANEQWQLVERVPAPKPAPVQGDSSFFTIATENPRLSGEVHFDGGELSFRLFRGGRLAWEKPAPSSMILIPSEADIVIMVGQHFSEGWVTLAANFHERFTAYDAHGKRIASVDTPQIRKLHLFPDGRLLYLLPHSIHLVDFSQRGRLLWEIATEVDSLFMLAGDSHFSTGKSLRTNDTYETKLFEANSGRRLASFTESSAVRPLFFAVSSDGRYAFLRTTNIPPGRLVCDVGVYEIGAWKKPAITLQGIPGNPVVADRSSKDGKLAIGYLPKTTSGNPNKIERELEIFDSAGNTLFQHGFAPGRVDFSGSYLRFDREGESLRILFLSFEYRFERLRR